jgi:3-methyladenine DNA glycosylase/8-oxoguanine DNA glycosylase
MEDESKLAYKFLLKVSKKQKHKRFNEFLSNSEVISLNSRTNDLTLDLFLIKTIISQQVSTKAARSIWLKTYEYIKNSSNWSEEQLRQTGLSRPKASYIYDILQNKELRPLTTKKILENPES